MFVEATLSVINLKTRFALRKRTSVMRLIANSLRLIGFKEVRYTYMVRLNWLHSWRIALDND